MSTSSDFVWRVAGYSLRSHVTRRLRTSGAILGAMARYSLSSLTNSLGLLLCAKPKYSETLAFDATPEAGVAFIEFSRVSYCGLLITSHDNRLCGVLK